MKKRLLSTLLALCLVVGMIPTTLLTAGAATTVSSVDLGFGTNYADYTSNVQAGMPGAPAASLVVYTDGVSITGVTSGNQDPENSRVSSGSTFAAGKIPHLKVTVRANSGYAFDRTAGLSGSLSGWNFQKATVSTSSATLEFTYGGELPYLTQTVGVSNAQGYELSGDITIAVGQTLTWKPYATYYNHQNVKTASTSLSYSSGNNQVATASATGVRGVKVGTTTVTITARAVTGLLSEATRTFQVNVVDKNSLTITGPSAVGWSVGGSRLDLGVTVGGSGTPASYKWMSSDPTILSFDSPLTGGNVSTNTANANRVGTVTVTVNAYSQADGTGALLGSDTHTVTITPLQVLTPKAGTRTVPFQDASNVISGDGSYAALSPFFDAVTHAQDNGSAIASGKYYTLSGRPTSNVSTYQVTATLIDPNNTVWEGSSSSAPMVFTFQVTAKPITDINTLLTTATDVPYTGQPVKPNITSNPPLTEGQDYILSSNEVYVKQDAMAVITGINNYTGTRNLYFNIVPADASGVLSVNGNSLYATKGQSIDLRKAIISSMRDINVNNLNGLTFRLPDDQKGKATLNGYTLKLNNTLGVGETIQVYVELPTTSYNVGGSSDAEYYGIRLDTTPIKIDIAAAVKSVAIPTAASGLVYNGKEQTGVVDGQFYNVVGGKGTNANNPFNPNDTYTATVSLDQSAVTDGSKLMWADGTTDDKTIRWTISRAKIAGSISFTEIKADGYTLGDTSLKGYFYDVNNNLFDIKNGAASLNWVAGDGTFVVQNATYGWELIPAGYTESTSGVGGNYDKVTGSVIVYGQNSGTGTSGSGNSGFSGGNGTTTPNDPTQGQTSTRHNPDGSTTTITTNKTTGVTTYVTTANNGTSSEVVYTNGVLTSASATSSSHGAVAFIPMINVSWGSIITINGTPQMDSGLPADNLQGMWVILPAGNSSLGVRNQARSFSDVWSSNWFYEAVTLASARNLIQGMETGEFVPAGTLNFGQIWSMLARYVGSVTLSQSTGSNWYVQPQNWAYRNGISSGIDYTTSASRENVALMLYRTYVLENGNPTVNTSYLTSLSDYGAVSSEARTAVAWAIQTGIIQGYPDSTFRPNNTIRRDEAAQMMARFMYVADGVSIPSDFRN